MFSYFTDHERTLSLPASSGYVRAFRSRSYSRSTDCQLRTSMEVKVILSGRNEDLTLQEALNLLQNAVKNPELVSYVPPVKPKAGDIFVYSPGENLHKIGESVFTHNLRL